MPKQDKNATRSTIRVLRFPGTEAAVSPIKNPGDAQADAIRKAWTQNKPSASQPQSAIPPREPLRGNEKPAS